MATQNIAYGSRTTITISPASLANAAYRESTEIDNSSAPSSLAVDAIVHGIITAGTSPTTGNTISIFVAGSDGTTTRVGNLTGTDSTITPAGEQTQFELARVITVDATSNHAYEFFIGSIAALFGGVMPKKWSVIVLNSSGVALNSTGGNHSMFYTPVTYTVA